MSRAACGCTAPQAGMRLAHVPHLNLSIVHPRTSLLEKGTAWPRKHMVRLDLLVRPQDIAAI